MKYDNDIKKFEYSLRVLIAKLLVYYRSQELRGNLRNQAKIWEIIEKSKQVKLAFVDLGRIVMIFAEKEDGRKKEKPGKVRPGREQEEMFGEDMQAIMELGGNF